MVRGKVVLFIHLILIAVCAYPLILDRRLRAGDLVGKVVLGVVSVGLAVIGLISFFPGLFYGGGLPGTGGGQEGWGKEVESIRNLAIVPAVGFVTYVPARHLC